MRSLNPYQNDMHEVGRIRHLALKPLLIGMSFMISFSSFALKKNKDTVLGLNLQLFRLIAPFEHVE